MAKDNPYNRLNDDKGTSYNNYPNDKKYNDAASEYDGMSEYDRYSRIQQDPLTANTYAFNPPSTSKAPAYDYPSGKPTYSEKSNNDYKPSTSSSKKSPAYDRDYPSDKPSSSKEKKLVDYVENSSSGNIKRDPYPNTYVDSTKGFTDFAPYDKENDNYDYDYTSDYIGSPVAKSSSKGKGKEKAAYADVPAAPPVPPMPATSKKYNDQYYDAPKPKHETLSVNYDAQSDYYNEPRSNYNSRKNDYVKPTPSASAVAAATAIVTPRKNNHDSRYDSRYTSGYNDYSDSQRVYKDKPKGHYTEKPQRRNEKDYGRHEISAYVGKWGRISRTWASYSVILLVFMGVGFLMMADSAREKAQDSMHAINSGCLSVQTASEAVINSPRTAAISSLTMVQTAAQSIIDLTGRSILKIFTMLQTLIVWVLKMYFGTYICIAEVIIRTALMVAEEVSKIITDLLNVAVDAVVSNLQNVAATVASGIQDAANGIVGFFTGGSNNNAVDFHVDDIRQQLDIKIPTDWISSISGLADKIPTEDDIFGNITELLDIPFNMLRNIAMKGFNDIDLNFVDGIKFPDEKNMTMCDNPVGQDTIKDIGDAVAMIYFIGGLAIIAAAGALIIFQIIMVLRSYNKEQLRMQEFRQDLVEYIPPVIPSKETISTVPVTREEMDLFKLPGNPILNKLTRWQIGSFGNSERTAAWRWWMDYVWYPPAFACLIAGAIGLACIFMQVRAIDALRAEYVPRLAQDFDAFQYDFISNQVLGSVRNDSHELAYDINNGINGSEYNLNRTLFGPINDGTDSLNNTLNDFVGTYINGIRSVFGGTVLEYPVEGLVNCTLTKNIRSLQKILSFIDEYASGVDLPRISENVLYTPALKLMSPVNKTVTALRKFAVGEFIPNATLIDAERFPTRNDLKVSSRSEVRESRISVQSILQESRLSEESEESEVLVSKLLEMSEMSALLSESGSEFGLEPDTGTGTSPAISASLDSSSINSGTNILLKRQVVLQPVSDMETADDIPTISSLPDSSSLISSISSKPLSSTLLPTHSASNSMSRENDGELGDLEDESSLYSYDYDTLPDSLTKEEIVSAQKYGGYTGGLVGNLCDSYVASLKRQIPLMMALISVWFIIALVGLVHVFSDYRKIKRYNMR
ncbi:plasma membrane fusion protein prm1 [Kickxella alabastrina]|uniref:Plasma membrane fusion protein prm1 n=1 Tax=Kickxella alabastrina TaxID=61397 RepID=A0ACC1IN63_9FUNG|nr:plasma membrane fusion protein prm1 [Kickxella alabastrina]